MLVVEEILVEPLRRRQTRQRQAKRRHTGCSCEQQQHGTRVCGHLAERRETRPVAEDMSGQGCGEVAGAQEEPGGQPAKEGGEAKLEKHLSA